MARPATFGPFWEAAWRKLLPLHEHVADCATCREWPMDATEPPPCEVGRPLLKAMQDVLADLGLL